MGQPSRFFALLFFLLCSSSFARQNFDHILKQNLEHQANFIKDSTLETINNIGDFREAYISELYDFSYLLIQQNRYDHDFVILYTTKIATFSEQNNGRDKEILNSPFPERYFNGYQNEICLSQVKYNSENYKIEISPSHCSYLQEEVPLGLSSFERATELFLNSEISTVKLALEFDFLAYGSEQISSGKNIEVTHLEPLALEVSKDLIALFRFELKLRKNQEYCEGLLKLNYSQNEEKMIQFLDHSCITQDERDAP